MNYPDSVLTKNKKGQTEVRWLLRKGTFVEYNYRNPKTGKVLEKGKRSIILKSGKEEEHYFIIPLKQRNKFLLIIPNEEKQERKVWDGERAVTI